MNTRLMERLTNWLIGHGITETYALYLKLLILLAILCIVAVITNFVVKKFLVRFIESIIKKTKTGWDDALVANKVSSAF